MTHPVQSQPDVSILIPVYNTAGYLGRALNSVLMQTHRNLEVIVIDDASPDNASEIIQEWQKRDPRVKAIRLETNSGTFTARRRGLQIAAGQYILNLDADDTLDAEAVESLLATAKKMSADIIGFGGRELQPDGSQARFAPTVDSAPFTLEGKRIFDAMFRAHAFSWSLCMKMIRRDLFLSAADQLEDQYCIFADDFLQFTPIAFDAKKMVVTGRMFYNYYKEIGITGNEQISLASFQKASSMFSALKSVRDFLVKRGVWDDYAEAFRFREQEQLRMLYRKWRFQLAEQDRPAALEGMKRLYDSHTIESLIQKFELEPASTSRTGGQHLLATESLLWYLAKRIQGMIRFRKGKIFHDC